METSNIITVKELINILKNFDPNTKFGIYTSEGLLTVDKDKVNTKISVEEFDDGDYLVIIV